MNTDNMSIAGETIDYGPCAFMDEYDPGKVFSSIDRQGRYAYGNQHQIATWNLSRLRTRCCISSTMISNRRCGPPKTCERLRPVRRRLSHGMRQKLGLSTVEDNDLKLVDEFLSLLATDGADFTLAFRRLSNAAGEGASGQPSCKSLSRSTAFEEWAARWRQRLAREPEGPDSRRARMGAVNPAFIPRNHRIEAVIEAAVVAANFTPFEALLLVLAKPFEEQPAFVHYMDPPQTHERVCQTFCGT